MAAERDRMVRCMECKFGKFMQWMKNPIVCECQRTGERQVAESHRLCSMFDYNLSKEAPEITHYERY